MQVFITGATGLIGSQLIQKLLNESHTVTILTRDIDKARNKFGNEINYYHSLSELKSLDNFDAVINLAGESIANKRWTEEQKEQLCQSRWQVTEQLVKLIKQSNNPPNVLISGSAIGYYGTQHDNKLTELSKPNSAFTSQLCQHWEELALSASSDKTRVCVIRTSVVLTDKGGALAKMLQPFRLGLGGVIGSGKQYMSWIHIQDMIDAIYFLLTTQDASGPFNMCSPNPVTNHEFSHTLAQVLKRPCITPIPSCALKLTMGEGATIILDGQRAIPEKLQHAGFIFNYQTLEPALRNLLTA